MKRLLKRAAGTFGLRISYTFLTFVTSVVLARLLGKAGFGTYTYVVSWAYLLAIPATLGFEGLVGREISIYQAKLSWSHISGLLRWANILTIFSSLAIATTAAAIAFSSADGGDPHLLLCFLLVMLALPMMALRNIRRGSMRGLDRIVLGLFPEMLVAPALILVLVALSAVWLQDDFTASWAVGIYVLATGVTLALSMTQLERILPFNVQTALPRYARIDWLTRALPFMFLESVNVINARADLLMLGQLNGVEATGIYVPVNRGAQLIVFVLMAFSGPLSPTIASLYATGKQQELQQLLLKAARVCLLVSAIATTALLIFGRQYLLVFGPGFDTGLEALRVLCIGKVLYVFVGLAPMVLSMTGHARLTAITGLVSVLINIALNLVLIPRYGVTGAAIATTCGLMASGVVNTIWAYKKVGLHFNLLSQG
ncbi:MAG: oligosaccharide flippase family protein [Phormidesmis sp.]